MSSHEHRVRSGATARAGYTLIELITVVGILSIVGMVSSFVIFQSMKVYSRSVPALNAAYEARTSMQRMRREIRGMQDTASISSFTSTALTFKDSSDTTIAYTLSGGELLRNGDAMSKGATSLEFTYWKSDGSSATSAAELQLVEIDLTVEKAGQPYRLQGVAFPRVLGHD